MRKTAKQIPTRPNKRGQKDFWLPKEKAAYEYHCLESHDSEDAELWYRSRQTVTVLKLDDGLVDGEPAYPTIARRLREGMPLSYKIRFSDGFVGTAFEDELLVDKKFFSKAYAPGVRP